MSDATTADCELHAVDHPFLTRLVTSVLFVVAVVYLVLLVELAYAGVYVVPVLAFTLVVAVLAACYEALRFLWVQARTDPETFADPAARARYVTGRRPTAATVLLATGNVSLGLVLFLGLGVLLYDRGRLVRGLFDLLPVVSLDSVLGAALSAGLVVGYIGYGCTQLATGVDRLVVAGFRERHYRRYGTDEGSGSGHAGAGVSGVVATVGGAAWLVAIVLGLYRLYAFDRAGIVAYLGVYPLSYAVPALLAVGWFLVGGLLLWRRRLAPVGAAALLGAALVDAVLFVGVSLTERSVPVRYVDPVSPVLLVPYRALQTLAVLADLPLADGLRAAAPAWIHLSGVLGGLLTALLGGYVAVRSARRVTG